MPIHDYRCAACGHVFEKLVRAADPAPACPACGSADSHRGLSAPVAPGRSRAMMARAREQARREGHLSHFTPARRSPG